MKIAVTGGTGLLGQALIEEIMFQEPEWEIVSLSRSDPPEQQRPFWKRLDVSDLTATRNLITRINPDLVIHTAAIRSPDDCERDPEAAFKVNFLGTRNVALACDRFDTEMLMVSSDQVFYGVANKKLHREWDKPKAANVYGQTKLLGETYVREHLRRWWIVRTAKIFGGPNDRTSFINMASLSLMQDKPINVVKEWASHITHAKYVSQGIIAAVKKKTYGIYHLVSPGVPSYWDVGEYLAESMGKPKSMLTAVSQKDLHLPAARAEYLSLSNETWKADFDGPLPAWQQGIDLFLSERSTKAKR